MLGRIKNMKWQYKVGVGVATSAAIIAGGGAAFAYFTGTGSGTGSGSVGSITTSDINVIGSDSHANYPGDGGGTVTFTAWNTGSGNEKLTTITLSGVTAKKGSTDVTSSCPFDPGQSDNSWSMANVTVGSDGDLAPGGSTPGAAITESGTLKMLDNGSDQSSCEGATLTLSFTTS